MTSATLIMIVVLCALAAVGLVVMLVAREGLVHIIAAAVLMATLLLALVTLLAVWLPGEDRFGQRVVVFAVAVVAFCFLRVLAHKGARHSLVAPSEEDDADRERRQRLSSWQRDIPGQSI